MNHLRLLALLLALTGTCGASESIEFNLSAGETTESVVVDKRGNLYTTFGMQPAVVKITQEGELRRFPIPARLPAAELQEQPALGALGLTLDRSKNIFVAVQGCVLPAFRCSDANGVWLIRPNGTARRLPGTDMIVFPNDVALDGRGNLYITDSITGAVWLARKRFSWRHRPQYHHAQIWIQDDKLLGGAISPIGANGITYSQHASTRRGEIIVANSTQSALLAIPILHAGDAGAVETIAGGTEGCELRPLGICDFRLAGIDGIALDRYGDIFAISPVSDINANGPVFGPSRLLSVKRRTGEVMIVQSGKLELPATDVATSPGHAEAKHLWVANPGFLDLSTPTLQRLELEVIWEANQ